MYCIVQYLGNVYLNFVQLKRKKKRLKKENGLTRERKERKERGKKKGWMWLDAVRCGVIWCWRWR